MLENIREFTDKFESCKTYITSLRTTNEDFLYQGRRKTGFLGFLIYINSAQILYNVLCQERGVLKYIPFYKLFIL